MGTTNFDAISAPDGLTGPHFGTESNQGTVLTALTTATALVLTDAQAKATRLEFTTGHASNTASVPVGLPGKIYVVVNNHASLAVLIKVAGGTAITVAATKTAILQVDGAGTELKRLTPDT